MNISDLKRRYIENPTAFWTTYSRMKKIAHRYRVGEDEAFLGNGVFSFSLKPSGLADFSDADAFYVPLDTGVVTDDPWVSLGYVCRLQCINLPGDSTLPEGFRCHSVHAESEKQSIIDVVNACYHEHRFGDQDFERLTASETFEPKLWLWAVESRNDTPVALFISEYDREIGEVNLDWCQVLPEYRNRGIGRALVAETIRRAEEARIVTVGTQGLPEGRFYERCGFTGQKYMFFKHKNRELLPFDHACMAAD